MKTVLFNIALFCVLAIAFSALTGCGSTSTDADTVAAGNKNSTAAASPVKKVDPSVYPPLPSELANAEIERLDGTLFTPSDMKGKVVLYNLWATWCGPCRGEMPHLIELQDKYRDQGFQIVGLDVGIQDSDEEETVEQITNFAKKMKLNYDLARIKPDVTAKFSQKSGLGGIPQSFLVDREGRLRGVFTGGGSSVLTKLQESVDKLMTEN